MSQYDRIYDILTNDETYYMDEGLKDVIKKVGGKVKRAGAVGALCVAGACSNADAPKSADTAPQDKTTTHQEKFQKSIISQSPGKVHYKITPEQAAANAERRARKRADFKKSVEDAKNPRTPEALKIKDELDKNKGSEGGSGYQPKGKAKGKAKTTPKPKPKPTPGSGVSADDDDI